jgi:hypothetical protein
MCNSKTAVALPLIAADETYVIDRKNDLVRKTDDPRFVAQIRDTQVGPLRAHPDGKRIGVEILHLCCTPDGRSFILDDSRVDVDELN